MVTRLRAGHDRGILVRFPVGIRDFSVMHIVHAPSGTHPGSRMTDTWDSIPGDKAAEA